MVAEATSSFPPRRNDPTLSPEARADKKKALAMSRYQDVQ